MIKVDVVHSIVNDFMKLTFKTVPYTPLTASLGGPLAYFTYSVTVPLRSDDVSSTSSQKVVLGGVYMRPV